jgi:hypothetical protein
VHEATDCMQQAPQKDGEKILVDPKTSLSCQNEPVTGPSRQPDESCSHLQPCLLRFDLVLI